LLDAQNSNISDLTGLEYCASLTTLDLSGNRICNISPLTNLNGLSLDNNQIIFSKGHLIIFSKLQLGGTRVEADLASIHLSSQVSLILNIGGSLSVDIYFSGSIPNILGYQFVLTDDLSVLSFQYILPAGSLTSVTHQATYQLGVIDFSVFSLQNDQVQSKELLARETFEIVSTEKFALNLSAVKLKFAEDIEIELPDQKSYVIENNEATLPILPSQQDCTVKF